MAIKALETKLRNDTGTAHSRRFRNKGLIPAVVYGHQQPLHVLINQREFSQKFKHIRESEILTLKLEQSELAVLIKNYQLDIVQNKILHLDFFEIEKGKVLRTHVQLNFVGTPIGVREGGVLETHLHELTIECLPKDLPEQINVDISQIEQSSSLHVADLEIEPNIKIVTHSDQVIAAVTHASSSEVEEPDESMDDEEVGETQEGNSE